MIVLGIDPGKKGALVALGRDDHGVALASSYYAGRHLVPSLLVEALRRMRAELGGGDVVVVVEAQQSMPRQGVSSTFATGLNYGRRLPDLDLTPGRCRVAQDGIADAAGMALAGRVLVGG